jgi:hypothetical protein
MRVPGSPYDIRAEIGRIAGIVAPAGAEPVLVKNYPSSFVGTDLHERLQKLGVKNLVVAGFMTHMCVNSTVRGAFNLGYAATVVAKATATRPLPLPTGKVVSAEAVQTRAWRRWAICSRSWSNPPTRSWPHRREPAPRPAKGAAGRDGVRALGVDRLSGLR